MKLCILVTTMNQIDLFLYNKMNLQTDAIIANQCDKNELIKDTINGHKVTMVSTNTRGLSVNRNIAYDNIYPDADYLMFSDDDLVYIDGYEELIEEEFSKHPEAQAIKFNLNCISDRKIAMSPIKYFHRVSRREISSWGVCGLVIRKNAVKECKLRFNENFGAGTMNYCGEDTIYLQEMMKKRIKLYATPVFIADIDQTESSWFEGYDARYFEIVGMVLGTVYPVMSHIIVLRSAYRFSRRNDVSLNFIEILRCYFRGIAKHG